MSARSVAVVTATASWGILALSAFRDVQWYVLVLAGTTAALSGVYAVAALASQVPDRPPRGTPDPPVHPSLGNVFDMRATRKDPSK